MSSAVCNPVMGHSLTLEQITLMSSQKLWPPRNILINLNFDNQDICTVFHGYVQSEKNIDNLSFNLTLVAESLRQRRLRDMKCTDHDLEVMDSNPSQVEFVVRSTCV